jgi:hypothetical protein
MSASAGGGAAAAAAGPPSPASAAELAELRRRIAALASENDQLKAATLPVYLRVPDEFADWPLSSSSRASPSLPPSPSPKPPPRLAAAPAPTPVPAPAPLVAGLAPGEVIIPHKINMQKLLSIVGILVLTLIVIVGIVLLETIGSRFKFSANNSTDTD